jgi:hypothetical protein
MMPRINEKKDAHANSKFRFMILICHLDFTSHMKTQIVPTTFNEQICKFIQLLSEWCIIVFNCNNLNLHLNLPYLCSHIYFCNNTHTHTHTHTHTCVICDNSTYKHHALFSLQLNVFIKPSLNFTPHQSLHSQIDKIFDNRFNENFNSYAF